MTELGGVAKGNGGGRGGTKLGGVAWGGGSSLWREPVSPCFFGVREGETPFKTARSLIKPSISLGSSLAAGLDLSFLNSSETPLEF